MMIPEDPVILLGFLNTKLRDTFASLDELCERLDCKKDCILCKMKEIGYEYIMEFNQFR